MFCAFYFQFYFHSEKNSWFYFHIDNCRAHNDACSERTNKLGIPTASTPNYEILFTTIASHQPNSGESSEEPDPEASDEDGRKPWELL